MKKLIVILAVIAMVGAFTATSIAAEWNFYGSSRMTTVRYDKAKEINGLASAPTFDDQDTTWDSQTNARIGSKVKASDAVSGQFEFQVGGAAEVKLRLMYGEYNFGSGSLLVGQDYTPVDQILSNSIGTLSYNVYLAGNSPVADGEGDALTIGSFYESRLPQIALKFGNLTLAFISPKAVGPIDPVTGSTSAVYTDTDTTIPKIEASYKFKMDQFSITPYAGYNTVDFTNSSDNSVSVDSYVFGAAGRFNFGPMFINANLFWAQNAENFGRANKDTGIYDGAVLNIAGTDVEDAESWGGQVIVGFKASDMLAFQAGYSYDHNEIDVSGVTGENDPSHWYVNATITLAPGVEIIPEVGMFDFGDDEIGGTSTDRGDCVYYGAEWKISF